MTGLSEFMSVAETLETWSGTQNMLTVTIDWLAGTIKEPTRDTNEFILWLGVDDASPQEHATNGYTVAARSKEGCIVSRNPDRPDMGTHIVLSGSALRNIQTRAGAGTQEILRRMYNAGVNFSRLDLAKDLVHAAFNYGKIWSEIQQKRTVGTARTFNRIEGHETGTTIYVGSRQSERFMRLYDKAAQTGETGTSWARLEVELKGMVARAAATELLKTDDWSGVFDGVARAMIDLPKSADWQQFFPPDGATIGLPKIERQTDREKWIATQVYPALMKHAGECPGSVALRDLYLALKYMLEDGDLGTNGID